MVLASQRIEAKFEHRAGDRASQVEGILTPKDIMALKKRDSCGAPKSGSLHNGEKPCSAFSAPQQGGHCAEP